jgi:ribonuclease HI
MSYCYAITQQFCAQSRSGSDKEATLATAPDADILREIVCLLTQRMRAGRATFLLKVKSHRGEPINERADTLAEEGREISDDIRG